MSDDYMCPNCVTPWKCNGPHLPMSGNSATHVAVRKMTEAEAKQCWKDSCEWSISDDEADDHMGGWLAALRWAGVIKEGE